MKSSSTDTTSPTPASLRIGRAMSAFRARLAHRDGRIQLATWLIMVLGIGIAVWRLVGPMFENTRAYGLHDWEAHLAYRAIVPISLRYFEGPWWHPWFCGGAPAWGYSESAPSLVSPYLPAYLALPIQVAARVEVLGQTCLAFGACYLLAGRFTRSVAVRALVGVLYSLNGRWALQATTGHTWHLQYAVLPLALYFFDTALEEGKLRRAIYAGLCLSCTIYWGGVYPAPHIALILSLYAMGMALARLQLRPLLALVIVGTTAFGFSAPKLLPVADFMSRYPRTTTTGVWESTNIKQTWEYLTNHNQSWTSFPFNTPTWAWHEYGFYIGYAGVAVIALGALLGLERRAIVLKIIGVFLFGCAFGGFHDWAPWTLLHHMPVFSSQRVPSRFMEPAVLLLGVAFASFAGRRFDPLLARRPWLDLVLLVPIVVVALDITGVGAKSTTGSFSKLMIDVQPPSSTFYQARKPHGRYVPNDWDSSVLIAMRENTGTVDCYGIGDIDKGAMAKGTPGYKGEAFFRGSASAVVTEWSPNHAVVEYDHAKAGDMLFYNMNWDSSWKANGVPVRDVDHLVAAPVPQEHGRMVFRYYPRTLNLGLALLLLTVLACWWRPIWGAISRWRSMAGKRPAQDHGGAPAQSPSP
ncbi:hypothetical protein LVJ94_45675 [Pendulispora rubella]|uniref:Mannosyltransferase n=1 Tax=Pendulispora rubella TaxID=2741070 RepID=A0ABZ2L4Q6_9BACT